MKDDRLVERSIPRMFLSLKLQPSRFVKSSSFTWGASLILIYFKEWYFIGHGCSPTIFPSPLIPFVQYIKCTVCAHLETQRVYIALMSPFVASRIQSDWFPSYIPGEYWDDGFLHWEPFSSDRPTLVQCHSSMWSGPVGSHRADCTLLQGPIQRHAISSSTKL